MDCRPYFVDSGAPGRGCALDPMASQMDLNMNNIYNDSVAAFNVMRDNIVTVVAPASILVHNSVTVPVVNTAS